MADCRALVQDDDAGLLQLGDDGARVVTGGLDDLDFFVDDDLGVGGVVGGNDGGEEGQVHSEGVFGHGATSADFFAEVFGGWLSEGCELDDSVRYCMQLGAFAKEYTTYKSKSACIANSRGQLSVSNPLHTTLHDGHCIYDQWLVI